MARLPRLTLPGVPHHVLQRGNNRQTIFAGPADYQLMLALVADHARAQNVAVHAFVLMDTHFQLLVTPQTAEGVGLMMQAIGRAYVRHFNLAQGRTGTLWEGRYRSTLIEPERHLIACMVYLDLVPVRAQSALDAASYAWSSHSHYVGQVSQRFLTPHALYWALGNTPFSREAAYGHRVQAGLRPEEQHAFDASFASGWPLGGAQFLAAVAEAARRRVIPSTPGRPRRRTDLSPK
jgi:putative transposase